MSKNEILAIIADALAKGVTITAEKGNTQVGLFETMPVGDTLLYRTERGVMKYGRHHTEALDAIANWLDHIANHFSE